MFWGSLPPQSLLQSVSILLLDPGGWPIKVAAGPLAAFYPVWLMGGTVKRAWGRGTSLVVQWLRFWASNAKGVWIQSLVRELRSHMQCSMAKKKKTNLKKKWWEAGGRARAGCLFSVFLSAMLPWLFATHSFWVRITTLFLHPFRQAKGR